MTNLSNSSSPKAHARRIHARQARARKPSRNPFRQTGMVMFIGLSLLIVITLFALAAIRGITAQERIAGNLYDREVAFDAAEATLRYVERQYMANNDTGIGVKEFSDDPVCGATVCDTATYFNPKTYKTLKDNPKFTEYTTAEFKTAGGRSAYGAPLYLVVKLKDSGDCGEAVRVNAVGVGSNENTVVVLESILCRSS